MSKEHYRWLRVWTETGHLKFQSEEKKAGVPELWGTVRKSSYSGKEAEVTVDIAIT